MRNMTTTEVIQRMRAGQALHSIEEDADWLEAFQVIATAPAVRDDQGEALFIVPIVEAR
jgi:hypothetical protein